MPLLKKRCLIGAGVEATPGTSVAATLVPSVYDMEIQADIPANERVAQGAFGRQASVAGAYAGSCKFKVEAVGEGAAGTPPAWAIFLQGCGMTAAGGVYTPVTAAASQKALTIDVYEDGLLKQLVGAMGSWDFEAEDGKPGVFSFDFKGVWQPPTSVSYPTPLFGTVLPPRVSGSTLTVGGVTLVAASKLSIKYGSAPELRQDLTQTAGYIAAVLTDRKVTGALDPETLIARDDFAAWLAGGTAALSFAIGTGGTGFTLAAPAIQYQKIAEANRNGLFTNAIDFLAVQNGSTVDSEITITF